MTAFRFYPIGVIALCLFPTGRVDAGIVIEADGARRDPANSVTSRDVGSIRVTNDTNRSASPSARQDVSQSETTFADSLANGQFRLFSADVSRRSETITNLPQQQASVIADGLRYSGDRSPALPQAEHDIRFPAAPAVVDDEIVEALFALPEPSALSLAILGTALIAAVSQRRWRLRKWNNHLR